MRHSVAPVSLSIKIISVAVIVLDAGLLMASFLSLWALLSWVFLSAIILGCFLRAPVAYEISPSGLKILFRFGSKQFGPVLRAHRVEKSMDRSIRLWGNGGMFAATGIFWNGTWGIFRAYVTTSDKASMVLVETKTGKVLVSPNEPERFIEASSKIMP